MPLVAPSTVTELYRLDLDGDRRVEGESGPLYATVDILRSQLKVDVRIRIVGHTGLIQRGIGPKRTLQISSYSEVRDNGVKIPGGYFEVHALLKRHGLGAIMMNAMLAWAHDYHPEANILPIGVKHDTFNSDRTPVPFYEKYNFLWTARSDEIKCYSYPRTVLSTHPMAISYPALV